MHVWTDRKNSCKNQMKSGRGGALLLYWESNANLLNVFGKCSQRHLFLLADRFLYKA